VRQRVQDSVSLAEERRTLGEHPAGHVESCTFMGAQ
jgi:hypothetical protein